MNEEKCDECDKSTDLRYCIKCGKALCSNCRRDYLCIDCMDIEQEDESEKALVSRIKPALAPFYHGLVYMDYVKIIEMIKLWRSGRIYLGYEKLDKIKDMCHDDTFELLHAIEQVVIYDKDLPMELKMPEEVYRIPPAHRGNFSMHR
jgi:hypothetical protein